MSGRGAAGSPQLRWTAAALLVLAGPIGIAIGVGDELPARVGCECRAADVGSDWIAHGTATSAPLIPLVVLLGAIFLSLRPGRAGTAGVVLLVLGGLAVFGASLGEPFVPSEADAPHFLIFVFRLASYTAALATVLLGIRDLAARPWAKSEAATED